MIRPGFSLIVTNWAQSDRTGMHSQHDAFEQLENFDRRIDRQHQR